MTAATHPATSLTTSRTKAVRLLRFPLVREMRGLRTRGVVFFRSGRRGETKRRKGDMSASIVCLLGERGPPRGGSGEQSDPPRGETASDTYMAAVGADDQAGSCGRFLGHLVRVTVVGVGSTTAALGDGGGGEEKSKCGGCRECSACARTAAGGIFCRIVDHVMRKGKASGDPRGLTKVGNIKDGCSVRSGNLGT